MLIVVAGLVVAVGALVQGTVGFGLALVAAPLLAILDPALVPVFEASAAAEAAETAWASQSAHGDGATFAAFDSSDTSSALGASPGPGAAMGDHRGRSMRLRYGRRPPAALHLPRSRLLWRRQRA